MKLTHPDTGLMQRAISEAKKSHEKIPCGAVIVSASDTILSMTYNKQHSSHDTSAHAEILGIREAGMQMRSKNLPGSVIYCTCEPCIMCLTAIIYAKISHLIFGSSLSKLDPDYLFSDFATPTILNKAPYVIKFTPNFLSKKTDLLYQ